MQALTRNTKGALPLHVVTAGAFGEWSRRQPEGARNWLADYKGGAGTFCVFPDAQGKRGPAVAVVNDAPEIWDLAGLAYGLPEGIYALESRLKAAELDVLTLGWALGAYQFTRYRKADRKAAQLVWPKGVNSRRVSAIAQAVARGRDLVNTPAEDMGPAELAAAIQGVGKAHGAKVRVVTGDHLLKENFPLVHAVGRASHRAARVITLQWGSSRNPKVTLVGKGVCFDTGGLDIKPSSGMYLMKKDMAGAAAALAAAEMVMALKLPVCLHLIVPTADNAISGNAFRPTDIFKARNGTTVEIGNTDAEGRLLLADALALAAEGKPELLIDFATLTGAARVAVGTEIGALFCNDDRLADDLVRIGRAQRDPVWRLPLEAGYRDMLKSKIADMNSAPASGYAGAITAALFLEHFAGRTRWAHIDMMGWHLSGRPGRPEGGAPMAARTVVALLEEMYGDAG